MFQVNKKPVTHLVRRLQEGEKMPGHPWPVI